MKKLISLAMVLTMSACLFTGCTTSKSNTSSITSSATAATASAKKVEIHYAYWQDGLKDYLTQCKANFEKAHSNITITLDCTAWDEYWTKLEAAATGGSVADVFQMNGVNISKYAKGGVLLPLDSITSSSAVDLSNYPKAMDSLYNVNGKQYGIPMDYDTIGLWYNKKLFDAAGISYPTDKWTWDDLVKAAKALTNTSKGIYGINAGYADQQGFYNTVFATGGYITNGTDFGFNDANTRKGIQCWYDLMKAGVSPSEASLEENAAYLQFMAGKLGMTFAGDWMVSYFSSKDSTVANYCDVTALPTINGKRASVIHGKANCVSASTKNQNEALAWVEYLAGDEANQILGKSGVCIPAYLKYSSLFFDQYPKYNMSIYLDAAKNYSYTWPSSTSDVAWADIMQTELTKAFNMKITVDQACDNITNKIKSAK